MSVAERGGASLSGHLAVIEPSLVPPLFEDGPLAGVRRLVDGLPACSAAGFECRLSEESRLDFHAFFSPPRISSFDGCGSGPEWRAIRRHAAECNSPGSLLAQRVMNYVLEFDMDAPPGVVRPPSFFIALNRSHATGTDAVLASVDNEVIDAVAECLRRLPPGGYVNHLGRMLSRPDAAVRLNLIMEPREIPGYLESIGWEGSATALPAVVREFQPLTKSFDLALDVSRTGPLRKIGFECFLADPQPILDVLLMRGLCTSAKARALQRWPGTQQQQTSPHWPVNISLADRFLGADVRSFFLRRLNHVKVVFEDGELTEAKAYLVFGHEWLKKPA